MSEFNIIIKLNPDRGVSMSKSKFFEGAIIGVLAGVVGTIWLLQDDDEVSEDVSEDVTSAKETSKKKKKSVSIKTPENTEEVVSKTLDAIEKGFDKISKMVDEKKAKK